MSVPGHLLQRLQFLKTMRGVDKTNSAGARSHNERVRRSSHRAIPHAIEEFAIGDAGGREKRFVSLHQVIDPPYPLQIDLFLACQHPLLLVARPQPALHVSTDAFEGAGGYHSLRRSADAHQDIDTSALHRREQGASHVTIDDELQAGSRFTNFPYQL